MLSYDILYRNVEEGLEEANLKLKEIYLDISVRVIVESLLLDSSTPLSLYRELLDFSEAELGQYKYYFFDIPENISRLEIYSFIHNLPSDINTSLASEKQLLFSEVFYNGWEFVDNKFNRGRSISITSFGETIFKDMLLFLNTESKKYIEDKDLNKLKQVLGMLKEGTKLYDKGDDDNKNMQLQLRFVEEIQNSVKNNPEEDVHVEGLKVGKFGTVDSSTDSVLNDNISSDLKDLKKKTKKNE